VFLYTTSLELWQLASSAVCLSCFLSTTLFRRTVLWVNECQEKKEPCPDGAWASPLFHSLLFPFGCSILGLLIESARRLDNFPSYPMDLCWRNSATNNCPSLDCMRADSSVRERRDLDMMSFCEFLPIRDTETAEPIRSFYDQTCSPPEGSLAKSLHGRTWAISRPERPKDWRYEPRWPSPDYYPPIAGSLSNCQYILT